MSAATIEVKFADPPKDGKKQGTVKAANGEVYGVWPDKLGLLRPGLTYEVEFTERTYQGRTYRTITKCKPSPTSTGGAVKSPIPSERVTTVGSPTPEQVFVTAILAAAVSSQVADLNDRNLHDAVMALRLSWGKTFGSFS